MVDPENSSQRTTKRKIHINRKQWQIYIVKFWNPHSRSIGGSRGAPGTRPPGSKFFHFHAVFGKNVQNNPNLGVGAPPRENPGSATVNRKRPPRVQILSFSCSFWQKMCKIIPIWELAQVLWGKSWIRHCGGLVPEPRANPGSATAEGWYPNLGQILDPPLRRVGTRTSGKSWIRHCGGLVPEPRANPGSATAEGWYPNLGQILDPPLRRVGTRTSGKSWIRHC